MEIDRRTLLTLAAGGAVAAAGGVDPAAGERSSQPLFAATRKSPAGDYSAAIFDAKGNDRRTVSLPGRGHDIAVCPVTRTCVAFARRPGTFGVAFSPDRTRSPAWFATPFDRHFYGHGVFSASGQILYATENDYEAGAGRIGLYDATDRFRRIGEFDAYGIGPHDIALMPDGRTLAIANGGIETHPEIGGGRTKLNLATMAPSLVYLDTVTGDLIERHALPSDLRRLSLRHLDVGSGRTVVLGGQLQRGAETGTPLILRHRLGASPTPVVVPGETLRHVRGYISSVAVDRAGEIAALTASRGGLVMFIDVATGAFKGTRALRDVSGVAAADSGFLLTSGTGAIALDAGPPVATAWQWDNHAAHL